MSIRGSPHNQRTDTQNIFFFVRVHDTFFFIVIWKRPINPKDSRQGDSKSEKELRQIRNKLAAEERKQWMRERAREDEREREGGGGGREREKERREREREREVEGEKKEW